MQFVALLFVGLSYAEPAAEADPSVLYGGLLGYPYGVYGGLYRPWGGYHLIGKRDAEAEAKPEAVAGAEAEVAPEGEQKQG